MESFVTLVIKHHNTMPAITRNITILILMLTLQGSLLAQQSNWTVSSAPKRCTVIIPNNISQLLPTTDTYQIGFFVFTNNTFMNVGSATYSSQGVRIDIAYDPQGINGYKENQRLITLIRNTSNQNVIYGVEFLYQNDQNKFILDGTITAQSIRYCSWWKIVDPTLCMSQGDYELRIPYGLKPAINFGAAIRNHEEDGRFIIDASEMAGGWNYELSITSPYIKYSFLTYNFNLQYFPVEELNTQYEICPGGTLTLPTTVTVPQGQLTRTPYGTTKSLTVQAAGAYTYSYKFAQNSCFAIDTVTIVYKSDCDNTGYPELINPQIGQELLFTKAEKIIVYDAAMTKVTEVISPCIWKGTNQNGNTLAPGLYFIIHEDGTTHDLTIMY